MILTVLQYTVVLVVLPFLALVLAAALKDDLPNGDE